MDFWWIDSFGLKIINLNYSYKFSNELYRMVYVTNLNSTGNFCYSQIQEFSYHPL